MSPKEIQAAVQALLPRGFTVMGFGQSFIAGEDAELFFGEFEYRGRHRYFSMLIPPPPSVHEIVNLILYTPGVHP